MSNPYHNPYASPLSQPQYHGMPAPHDKPAAITVFGILNLVFGALGVCSVGFTIINYVVAMNHFPNQRANPLSDDPFGVAFQIAALAVTVLAIVFMTRENVKAYLAKSNVPEKDDSNRQIGGGPRWA